MPSPATRQRFGPYVVAEVLGQGAMATVYRAFREDGLDGSVAIKCMHPHLTDDADAVSMFEHEAQVMAAIDHPNVCALRSFDPQERFGANQPAMVLELVPGVLLSTLLAEFDSNAGLAPHRAALRGVFVQLCDALHAVHEARDSDGSALNIVHRDVSPQNVIVNEDGQATLIDFGVARSVHLNREHGQRGRASYTAPEQLEGEPVDRRTDVWSLGVLMYEALSGQNPFRRSTEPATFHAVMQAPVPALSTRGPASLQSLVAPFDAVVLSALERDARVRASTAAALATKLRAAVGDTGWDETMRAQVVRIEGMRAMA